MVAAEVQVLLVDDNQDDVTIVRRLLSQYDRCRFEVFSVNSTSDGLARLVNHSADMIFLDYAMPEEDAISFMRRAAALITLPPVVILTGHNNYRLVIDAMRWGASDFLYKPAMTSQRLGQAVEHALAKSQEARALGRYDRNVFNALVRSLTNLDPTLGGNRLAGLAVMLAGAMGLNDHQIGSLRDGALLHDVGKLGVRSELIFKPGRLTAPERQEVQMHPLIGERLCAPLQLSPDLAPIIRHHHERWDGTGYVDGLIGEATPLLARVIGVVDAFDAMTVDRPYRKALSFKEAVRRLHNGAGTQWDPEIVGVFLDVIADYLKGQASKNELCVAA